MRSMYSRPSTYSRRSLGSRTLAFALGVVAVAGSSANAQAPSSFAGNISRFNVSLGYDYIRANAPPADCGCFSMNGGYFSASYHVNNWFSVQAEITGQHGSDISALGQNLNLLTFAAGPKVQVNGGRYVPFGEVLVGGAHGGSSYFPSSASFSASASSFALQAGGGVELLLSDHWAVRLVDAEYLRTTLPNGTTNEQNQLMVGTGIIYRFDSMRRIRREKPMAAAPAPAGQISLSCSSNVPEVNQGDTLEITANSITEPAGLPVTYTWSASAGSVIGSGARVQLNTQGMAPGQYHVAGHAVTSPGTSQGPSVAAGCDVAFSVKSLPQTDAAGSGPSVDPAKDREFHANVPDALFDYDSAQIRPDAQASVEHAAVYLQAHPDISVLIGGYADDRGSAEYNLALGQQRAESARKALIAAGIQPERLKIVSYGKEVQVCTEQDEACRQQNRRAAFGMHP